MDTKAKLLGTELNLEVISAENPPRCPKKTWNISWIVILMQMEIQHTLLSDMGSDRLGMLYLTANRAFYSATWPPIAL